MQQIPSMRWLVVASCVVMFACTTRNKDFCGDGTCIDPAQPYCDFDGSVAGNPGTCIAVTCTPGEFETCRGSDQAVTCTANGNNFEVTACSLGCDRSAHGCKQCTASSQCSESAPVCDLSTSSCRKCTNDDECPSKVCNGAAGTCLSEAEVVYASADGIAGSCSLSQPCSLAKAVVTAANAPVIPTVRMLPGNFTTALFVDVPTAAPLEIVGTGATIGVTGNTAAVTIVAGGNVRIRNLTSVSERHIDCGRDNVNDPRSSLAIRDSTFTRVGNGASSAGDNKHCTLSLDNVDLAASSIGITGDTTFSADRLRWHDSLGASLAVGGAGNNVRVTNSVIERLSYVFTNAGGSEVTFAFDTFSIDTAPALGGCNGVRFENSIVQVIGVIDPFPNSTCVVTNTIASHNTPVVAGVVVADPQLVNVAAKDFHLKATSPARDAAVSATIASDHDFEGVLRPQGAKADIGAYELH